MTNPVKVYSGEIPEGWEDVVLSDMAELVKDGYKPTGSDNFAYIGLEHINQQSLSLNSIGHSTEVESNKFVFQSGDILFGKLRPYFRKVYRPRFSGVCSTDIWVVRAKEGTDQGFLFYFMANQDFIDLASSGSSGTRMPRADWGHLQDTVWKNPPITEQRAIAKILSDRDEKIELNHQMNKTLEAIAQAIFKQWLVDFEFPDKNGKPYKSSGGRMIGSELGEIPEGWEIKEIADCGEVVCGKTPPTADKENYGEDIFFITIPDIRDQAFVIRTERKLSNKGTSVQKNKELPPLSICVSCIATPGLVSITSDVSHTNQQINSIVSKEDVSPFFMYYTMIAKSEEIKTMGLGGTATLNLNTGNFARIKITMPDHFTMNAFHKIIKPFMERVLMNARENLSLSDIRDSLLPKLMSGKIRANLK